MGAVEKVLVQGAGAGGPTLTAALGQRGVRVDVVEAAGPRYRRQRDRTLLVADLSLALPGQGPGGELRARDTALLQLGIPRAQARIAAEAHWRARSSPLGSRPRGCSHGSTARTESCPTPATPESP